MTIREIRRRLGLTQGQLAERLHTTQATVSRWEADDSFPRGPAGVLLHQLAEEAATKPEPDAEADASEAA